MKKGVGKKQSKKALPTNITPLNMENLAQPFKFKFKFTDFLQIIIGASILAVPVGFTEETWNLGASLPLLNIYILMALTLFFISIFTYFYYHKEHVHAKPRYHLFELTKRVLTTYIASFAMVALLLHVIQVTPWSTDPLLAFKRIVIVTFPSSLGAAISDTISK